MTSGPLEFLRDCLDEDEAAAHKAAALCGCHPGAPKWRFGDESTDGRILVVGEPHPGIRRKIGRRWNGSYEGLVMAEHIVRHDPARVLREVEAKREIARWHSPSHKHTTLWEWPELGKWCGECNAEPCRQLNSCPVCGDDDGCRTVRLLLLPYADRPGYKEDWRP